MSCRARIPSGRASRRNQHLGAVCSPLAPGKGGDVAQHRELREHVAFRTLQHPFRCRQLRRQIEQRIETEEALRKEKAR